MDTFTTPAFRPLVPAGGTRQGAKLSGSEEPKQRAKYKNRGNEAKKYLKRKDMTF
jgi:hypothetical protein